MVSTLPVQAGYKGLTLACLLRKPTCLRSCPSPPEQVCYTLSFKSCLSLCSSPPPPEMPFRGTPSCQVLLAVPATPPLFLLSELSASAGPCSALPWAQRTQSQTCQSTREITQARVKSGRVPWHSSGSHGHVVKSSWVSGSFSSLPDYPEATLRVK